MNTKSKDTAIRFMANLAVYAGWELDTERTDQMFMIKKQIGKNILLCMGVGDALMTFGCFMSVDGLVVKDSKQYPLLDNMEGFTAMAINGYMTEVISNVVGKFAGVNLDQLTALEKGGEG